MVFFFRSLFLLFCFLLYQEYSPFILLFTWKISTHPSTPDILSSLPDPKSKPLVLQVLTESCTYIWTIIFPSNLWFICLLISLDFVICKGKLFVHPCAPNSQSHNHCSQNCWWINKRFLLPGFQILWVCIHEWSCDFFRGRVLKYLPLWLNCSVLMFYLKKQVTKKKTNDCKCEQINKFM